MRKIEKEVIGAFVNGDTKAIANTESAINPTTRDLDLLLHGNRIATMSNRDGVKKLWVSCGGYEVDGSLYRRAPRSHGSMHCSVCSTCLSTYTQRTVFSISTVRATAPSTSWHYARARCSYQFTNQKL